MGKTKAVAKGENVAKLVKESKKPAVKEGRVTKPTQTPKAKSKELAKSAAANHTVRELSKKKAKKAPIPEPESNSSDSDSESEVSSESDSSASSSEDEEIVIKAPTKANTVSKPGATAESNDSSDASSESSNDSSEDDDSESEAAAPKINGVKPKLNGVAKPAVGSEDDSNSDSSENDDSSNESDSSEDEDEKSAVDAKINGVAKAETAKKPKASSNSDSESDSDSNSDDSSDSNGSSASESEKEEASKKRKAEHESAPVIKKTKTNDESEDGIKNLFVGNLSWNVDEEWLARDFENFGEIVGCRIVTDKESGRSRGFGYVEYSTSAAAKAAQAAMHQFSLDGRALNVDFSTPRQKGGEKTGDRAKRFGDALGTPSNTLFVGNIAFDATNEMISEAFGEYGTLTRVSLPTDRETGAPKGFGYVDFTSMDDAKAALEALNGTEIAGRPIRLDYAAPRDGNSGPPQRGGFGNRGRGGDRGRGGRGGGFGGRGGGRGGKANTTNRGGFGDFKGSKMTF